MLSRHCSGGRGRRSQRCSLATQCAVADVGQPRRDVCGSAARERYWLGIGSGGRMCRLYGSGTRRDWQRGRRQHDVDEYGVGEGAAEVGCRVEERGTGDAMLVA